VLVVEDHPDSRELLRVMLEPLGAKVLLAEHGRAGLRLLMDETPHVILCDLLMPRMDGLAFAYHLRLDPRWCRIPLIAVTALGSDADHIRTWAHGFAAHLTKPVGQEQLVTSIRRVLQRR
jgi:two-component system, cell cycle response regulator DivK